MTILALVREIKSARDLKTEMLNIPCERETLVFMSIERFRLRKLS